MAINWSSRAQADLVRLHTFLEPVNTKAAAQIVRALIAGIEQIPIHPRIGQQLAEFAPDEVRRLLIGDYEVRYAIDGVTITIVRLWHSREDR